MLTSKSRRIRLLLSHIIPESFNRTVEFRMRSAGLAATFCLIAIALGCDRPSFITPDDASPETNSATNRSITEDPVQRLRDAIYQQDWNAAGSLVSPALISQPSNPDVLTEAAIVNAKLGRLREAAQLMVDAVVAANFDTRGQRVDNAVRALIDVGQLYDAIDLLRKVVESKPEEAKYRRMLIGFLGEAQLVSGLEQHVERLIRDRTVDIPILIATTETFTRRFSQQTIELILERNPTDRRPRLALAQQQLDLHDLDATATILEDILSSHPDFGPAHALMSQVQADKGEFDELGARLSSAPPEATDYAEHWLAVGAWAMHRNDLPGAVRAFWESTKRSPSNSLAWTRLAAALRQLSFEVETESGQPANGLTRPPLRDDEREKLLQAIDLRIDNLLALRKRFHEFSGTARQSQKAAVAVSEKLFDLGRTWEAEAWSAIATTLKKDLTSEIESHRKRVLESLADCPKWINDKRFFELSVDLSGFPFPSTLAENTSGKLNRPTRRRNAAGASTRAIRLVEESKQRGIDFYGRVGDQVQGPRVPLTQSVGCGGGAIDFDNDGFCDLYFTAAGGTAFERDSDPGRVYRNLGGTFVDVTTPSGAADLGFGQGVAIGDYNDDGFADLFMLVLGTNRLYRNNGDGTFTDSTDETLGTAARTWSTSGAIIDVDGDNINDLVAANYCDSNQPIDVPCHDKKTNALITCSPMQFMGGRDEFYRGRGDGTFEDVSSLWTEQASPGRGLGIIAGKLDGKQMGVYIANDMSANDYYLRRVDSGKFSLTENATASGIAVDAQTLTQASMGIAASDLDNDGDLDIFVTGFSGEYNIYYEQVATGFWIDKTTSLGLAKPSLDMVAFGTVASDLDGDGLDELLVTNGNVGEFGGEAPPYALPFQLFRRNEVGLFAEENVNAWGEYFDTPHVGRAMWTLDADADGMDDFVVTHQTEPASLLINRSEKQNQRLGFRLVGTAANRDAVGSIIRFDVRQGNDVVQKTLFAIAGGGYLCSNEPIIRCGTGDASKIQNLTITWPDGSQQVFAELTTGREYLIVEGESEIYLQKVLN